MSMEKVESQGVGSEIPQSHTADQPTTPCVRATKHQKLQDIYGEVCALHRSY